MQNRNRKKKTPSRIKYEHNHPTVSFRVSKELKDRLEAVKKAEGKSNTDVLKVGVGLLEVKVSEEKEAKRQGYKEGFEKGYEEPKNRYMVPYPCYICVKPIAITSPKTKEVVSKFLTEHGWGHTKCQ